MAKINEDDRVIATTDLGSGASTGTKGVVTQVSTFPRRMHPDNFPVSEVRSSCRTPAAGLEVRSGAPCIEPRGGA